MVNTAYLDNVRGDVGKRPWHCRQFDRRVLLLYTDADIIVCGMG